MAYTLEINGVQKEFIQGTFTNEKSAYNRSVVSFDMRSDGTYRPSRDDEVEIRNSLGVVKFAGFVESFDEAGYGDEPISEIKLRVYCADLNTITDRRMLVQTFFAEGTTLLQALTTIVNSHLATDGVTLDPSQVTGPTLPFTLIPSMSVTEVLDLITRPYGYIWEIDYDRELRAFVPGINPAPFDIIEPTDPTFGDIRVEDATTMYANRVIGRFGTGDRAVIDEFTGDGATTVFGLNYYPLLVHFGYVNVGGTIVNGAIVGGVNETLGDATATWSYDPLPSPPGTVGQVTRNAGPVANGVAILFSYISQMPVVVIANEPSEQPPVRDVVLDLPDIFDRATAEEAVQQALEAYVAQPRMVTYTTYQEGLRIGMSQTVTVAKRAVNAVGYITQINESHLEGDIIRHEVTWVEGDVLLAYWGDIYHEWSELGGGGASTLPPVVTGGIGPGAPNRSVQFNRNQTFGGDAAFIYYEAEDSVVCGGGGSSITAASFESCQVFGHNCHISD